MPVEYFDTIEGFRAAIDRLYDYCVAMDKPVEITPYRYGATDMGGIACKHNIIDSTVLLNQIETSIAIEARELMDLCEGLEERLMQDGYLVHEKCYSATHRFKIKNGRHVAYYFSIMSDEEAVIQGFRHGAVEIKRFGEVLV